MSAPRKLPPDAILAMAVRQAEHDADVQRIAAMSDEEVARELDEAQRGQRGAGAVPIRPRPRWVLLVAAAILLLVALAVAAALLRGGGPREREIRPDDTPLRAPPTQTPENDKKEADRLRLIALDACSSSSWAACAEGLDRAKALDPAGEADPRVMAARAALAAADHAHEKSPPAR